MKRLLCIISCMNTGGAETFLMKMFRNIDRKQYMMDFCVVSKENYYEEEIKQLGGKMFYIPLKSKHPVKSFNAIRRIVKENNYNYVKEILPNAEIYVYVLKENIVGFIGINENYIEGIFIDTNNQCKGIGTSLLNKVKENRDKDTAEIEYTMTWNK